MNMMNRFRLVFFVFSVMYAIFTVNAFSEEYTRWGLPTGAKTRFGKGRVYDIKYFPDGNKIAVATTIGTWIYDAQTGEEINLLSAHTEYVKSVAFSPDGKVFATGSGDKTIMLWDTDTGKHKTTLIKHEGTVTSVAFSPGGNILASGSYDDTVQLWDIHAGKPLKTLRGHEGQSVLRGIFSEWRDNRNGCR